MLLSSSSLKYLETMKIDTESFDINLRERYGEDSFIIEEIIAEFSSCPMFKLVPKQFHDFMESRGFEDKETNFYTEANSIFYYILLFRNDGVFYLFKNRPPDFEGPTIRLDRNDAPDFDCSLVPDFLIIFRGMSKREFDDKEFGQSWTSSIEVARKFAFDYHCDSPRGVVAKCLISSSSVIYFDDGDEEKEVIVGHGIIKCAKITEI